MQHIYIPCKHSDGTGHRLSLRLQSAMCFVSAQPTTALLNGWTGCIPSLTVLRLRLEASETPVVDDKSLLRIFTSGPTSAVEGMFAASGYAESKRKKDVRRE